MNNVSRHKLYRIYFSDTFGHFRVYAFCSYDIKDDGLYIYKNNGSLMSFTGLGMLAYLCAIHTMRLSFISILMKVWNTNGNYI